MRAYDHIQHGKRFEGMESKVAEPKTFARKKGGELYKWSAQLRLVFSGKYQIYYCNKDKIAYAFLFMSGTAQDWAMLILQALDEGCQYELFVDYNAFREVVIVVYGDID